MSLVLCPVGGVAPAQLLPLHPSEGQLLELGRKHNEGNADHGDHEELGGPNVRHEVPVAHRRERHDHKVGRVEEGKAAMAGTLEVLDTADAREDEADEGGREDGELLGEGGLTPLHCPMKVIEHILQGILGQPTV